MLTCHCLQSRLRRPRRWRTELERVVGGWLRTGVESFRTSRSQNDETSASSVLVLERSGEDRENPHIVRELVQCGKPSCRCAREQKYRHGPYRYLRYDGYNPQTGAIRYRREYVPARELARVRALVRRSRAARARTRAVLGLLRRHVTAMEYRARRRARIQTSQ